MKDRARYLEDALLQDALANQKMAFLSGPRQSGKTTLGQLLLEREGVTKNYFSWDDDSFQRLWIKDKKKIFEEIAVFKRSTPLIVLDEIHKFRNWKNSLKGFYDLFKKDVRILVTGSARLDMYRRSGDSLIGRYIPYRLHPFSYAESSLIKDPPESSWPMLTKSMGPSLDDFLKLGPFPDPLLSAKENLSRRWWESYRERVVREDLRDLREVSNINLLSTLVRLLPDRVGSGLSFQSLQEDLHVSFESVRAWIEALEALFLCFMIRPYSKNIKFALRKEPKIYFYHWPAVSLEGPRLENLVASHLLKSCHAWSDSAQGQFELHYIKDKNKREVDFCVTKEGKPWLLVEVKSSAQSPTPALEYYTKLLNPKFSMVVWKKGPDDRIYPIDSKTKILGMKIEKFLSALN